MAGDLASSTDPSTWGTLAEAEYLREGDIRDNQDGSITLFPVRSDTDLLTFHIGLTVGLVR